MQDQGDFIAHPFIGILWIRKDAKVNKLSDKVTLMDRDDHTFSDFVVEGLDGFSLKFNEKTRSLTVRQDAPEPKPEASSIDAAFAEMGGSSDFTLDVVSPAEAKFKAMCDKHGYGAVKLADGTTLSERIRTLIQENGKTVKIRDAMNVKLTGIGKPEMSADDWKVAVAAATAK